ncbi:MAG: hypothetical protein K940chlam7_01083 [Chlamydiae bacterium]|nr:hypothetical protein [Chlamydiota bacterium]
MGPVAPESEYKKASDIYNPEDHYGKTPDDVSAYQKTPDHVTQ